MTALRPVTNTSNAVRYADYTFAVRGFNVTNGINTFTAIARSSAGIAATNRISANLPATNTLVYDANGNLRTNGNQILEYDDENQLTGIYTSPATGAATSFMTACTAAASNGIPSGRTPGPGSPPT